MGKTRRNFPDTVKADAVRGHLSEKIPVNDLADDLNVPSDLIHL